VSSHSEISDANRHDNVSANPDEKPRESRALEMAAD
jgi:hypothetical protein